MPPTWLTVVHANWQAPEGKEASDETKLKVRDIDMQAQHA